MPLKPAETRPIPNFPEWESYFLNVQSAKLNTDETFLWLAQSILAKPQLNHAITYLSIPFGNQTITHFRGTDKIIPTTYHLLTFKTSEISSNNSEKLSLLADKHLWTFTYTCLIQVSGCKGTRTADEHRACFHTKQILVHLQFCSHLLHLTHKSLFPRPKT